MMQVDQSLLEKFESQLNPAYPEKSGIVPTILGYGEISSSFCIDEMPDIAFKRMPPFDSLDAVERYRGIIDVYCRHLNEDCGVNVIPHDIIHIVNRFGEHIIYVAQPRLDAEGIGNIRLRKQHRSEMHAMITQLAERIIAVGLKNRDKSKLSLGLDGQISNWWFSGADAAAGNPIYFDITTPLLRINGLEQLDTEIFLKSCPGFLVWLVRWQFLQEVLDRYYNTREVLIDLVANFHKEGCAALIDDAIATINAIIAANPLDPPISALTRESVDNYYKNDAFIWALFLQLRRIDRFVRTRVLRKRYNFILPGKITR